MQFKKPEWDRFDSMKLRLIVHHFNEEMQRYRPVARPKKPLTWAQALAVCQTRLRACRDQANGCQKN